MLSLGRGLDLPDQTITDTLAVLARRGAGKTYLAMKLAEQMLGAGHQIVAIDPTGVWWGLHSSADGTHPGFPVVVLGGNEADVPLEPTGGHLVADLVVEERVSCVLDVSTMRKGQRTQFLTDFAERLFERKSATRYKTPVHLFVDEAHAFVPQRPQRGQERMLGAGEDLVQMGRSRGIGVTLITQRPAVVNKNVLSQVSGVLALQLTAPQDRKALDAWFEEVADQDSRRLFISDLDRLKVGEVIAWIPHLEVFARSKIAGRVTFDSSATPAVGEVPPVPTSKAEIDLDRLRSAMADTIERFEQNDPKRLRRALDDALRRITELETETAVREPSVTELHVVPDKVVASIADIRENVAKINGLIDGAVAMVAELTEKIDETTRLVSEFDPVPAPAQRRPVDVGDAPVRTRRVTRDSHVPSAGAGGVVAGRTERRVLAVLAQFPDGADHDKIALLAGYSKKASTVSAALSKLRKLGWVTPSGLPQITAEGLENAEFEPLPTGPDLLEFWRRHPSLGQTEHRVLDHLIDVWPDSTTQAETAAATGYSPTASTVSAAMSKLRKVGLAVGWQASDELMRAIQ